MASIGLRPAVLFFSLTGVTHWRRDRKVGQGSQVRGPQGRLIQKQFLAVRHLLGQDAVGIARIAKDTGLTRQTVYRIKDDPAGAEAALAAWGL
jgi:hypothetical protein